MEKPDKPIKGLYEPSTPYSPETCQELLYLIEELLDGTISEEKRQFIIEKIQICPYCASQYQIELKLRELLKQEQQRVQPSSILIEKIRKSLNL
jgi:hypothetical protein